MNFKIYETCIKYGRFWLMDFYISFKAGKYKRASDSLLKEIKLHQKLLTKPVIFDFKKDKGVFRKIGPEIHVNTRKGIFKFSLSGFSDAVSILGIGLYLFLENGRLESYYQKLLPDFMKLKEISLKLFKEYSVNEEIHSFYEWGERQGDPYVIECDYKSIDPRLGELLSGFVPMLNSHVEARLNFCRMSYGAFYYRKYYFNRAVIFFNQGHVIRSLEDLAKEIQIQISILLMPLKSFDEKEIVFPSGLIGGYIKPQLYMPKWIATIGDLLAQIKKKSKDNILYEKVFQDFLRLKKEYGYFDLRVRNDKKNKEKR